MLKNFSIALPQTIFTQLIVASKQMGAATGRMKMFMNTNTPHLLKNFSNALPQTMNLVTVVLVIEEQHSPIYRYFYHCTSLHCQNTIHYH